MLLNDNTDLTDHILPNSATMVGACMMVIGVVKGMPPNVVTFSFEIL